MSLPRADEWTDPGPMDLPPRRGRRVLLVVGLIAITAIGSFLIWRGASLRGVPDLGDPFDAQALGTIDVPDDENAFTDYRRAVALFRDNRQASTPYLSWTQAPQRDRDWLFANAEAMDAWFEGTTRDRALLRQPKDVRIANDLDVVGTLRRLIWLDQLVGLRMEAMSELGEAWGWYRAGLRCSRHCEMDGGFRARLVGIALWNILANSVRAWADHPNLSPSNLRQALDELNAIDAMTPPLSQALRAEYFAYAALLDDPELSTWKILQDSSETRTKGEEPGPLKRLEEAAWRLVLREPERSRRVLRLVWANWLSAADLTPSERLKRVRKLEFGYYYDPPPGAPVAVRRLTPERLDRWVGSTLYLRAILPAINNLDKAEARDAAARGSLIVDLAEQLYTRENGRRPDSPYQLVGPYLKALPEGIARPSEDSSPPR